MNERKFIRKAFQLYEGIIGNICSNIKALHGFTFEFFRGYNELEFSHQKIFASINEGIEYYHENVIPKLDLTNSQKEYLFIMLQNMRYGTISEAINWNRATAGVATGYFWEETYRKRRKKTIKKDYLRFINNL